ncbi:MAG: ATP-binding protein [Planctomycetota bacterium]
MSSNARDPISEVADAIERFGAGDLDAQARGGSELAQAFNRMAGRIRDRLGTAQDVLAAGQSELQAHQRQLGRAERLAALGALAARLAHELGTPLHSVAGHLDLMLADDGLPAALRERALVIAGEVDRLGALIRNHLKRLRSPQPEVEATDLSALVRKILDLMRPLLEVRSVTVELDLAADAAEPFPCDPRQVEQVVLNLVQNALDAMLQGGTLIVRTMVTEHGRAISVADSGSGVAAEHLDRVFEPFFTTKGAGHGTGLGLSLCREIAHNHGGDIVLDSKPGMGTVVTLTLGVVPA